MAWLKNRFRYAWAGIRYGLVEDKSIRLQCILGCLAILASAFFHISFENWLWIGLAITLVIMAEIFNSCIEKTVDYISLERNPKAKVIKDMAAGAVLMASLFALVVALIILFPPFLTWIQTLI